LNKPITEKALNIEQKVISLRGKLGQKAKQEPRFKFYSLYGHIIRKDVLEIAWKLVYANKGRSGIDGITFDDIINSSSGIKGFLNEIRQELINKKYKPQLVLRVYIPKSNGKLRPLGIPTIKDRVIQMAAKLILEPIFEADFLDCSFGFRPNRTSHQALDQIKNFIQKGYKEVYDADLKEYFDNIPHEKLIKCIQMRIVDRQVLKLIRMWLKTPIVDKNRSDNITKSTCGIPQGGVISPLLSNIYLHWFDKVFHGKKGPCHWAKAKLIRFADDWVVLAKYQSGRLKEYIKEKIENWMGLSINVDKTKIVKIQEEESKLNFLGFTFQYKQSHFRKGKYLDICPSKKTIKTAFDKVHEITSYKYGCLPIKNIIGRLNKYLVGWGNYYRYGNPSKMFQKLNWYVSQRLRKHLKRRSQRPYKLNKEETWYDHFNKLGLVNLTKCNVRVSGDNNKKA
jgi:RNA-directed DNA polymerase